jgi:hypothetical protein
MRDLYIPERCRILAGALRDPTDEFADARLIEGHERIVVDVLYGDHEGGQRVITRFAMNPRDTTAGS